MIEPGAMRPEWCFVTEEDGQWIGRGAAWTLPRVGRPLDLVLLDLPFEDQPLARRILEQFIPALRALDATDLGYVLDDPSQALQWQYKAAERHDLLVGTGWTMIRETHRWERVDGDDVLATQPLVFRSLSEVDDEAFIEVVEQISAGSLDRRIDSDREQHGPSEAARREFHDLQDMDYEPHWWELAYTPSGELVGMVMPTGSPTFGTIGYIGVVPEQRGHGYGDALLARGTATLRKAGYERLVCDTDVANVPMANAFRRANYTQFGTRREYRLEHSVPL
jgi:ribosomal protein S18 acetylase RimI-like enzyme